MNELLLWIRIAYTFLITVFAFVFLYISFLDDGLRTLPGCLALGSFFLARAVNDLLFSFAVSPKWEFLLPRTKVIHDTLWIIFFISFIVAAGEIFVRKVLLPAPARPRFVQQPVKDKESTWKHLAAKAYKHFRDANRQQPMLGQDIEMNIDGCEYAIVIYLTKEPVTCSFSPLQLISTGVWRAEKAQELNALKNEGRFGTKVAELLQNRTTTSADPGSNSTAKNQSAEDSNDVYRQVVVAAVSGKVLVLAPVKKENRLRFLVHSTLSPPSRIDDALWKSVCDAAGFSEQERLLIAKELFR